VFPVSRPTLILFQQIFLKINRFPEFSRNWSIVLQIVEEFFNRKTMAPHILCSSRVVAMQFKECCHMSPINTISCVETWRKFSRNSMVKCLKPDLFWMWNAKSVTVRITKYECLSKLWPLTTWQTSYWSISSLDVGKLKLWLPKSRSQ
jgi:hypothetical protein